MKGDSACSLVSGCQLLVLEWMDCTIEVCKEDTLGLCFQRLRERHLGIEPLKCLSQSLAISRSGGLLCGGIVRYFLFRRTFHLHFGAMSGPN